MWTNRHRDVQNCPYGWCSIQALGEFDHKLGGHLVLDDLKLVLEFPAGSTILIPSATFDHANLPLGKPGDKLWSQIGEEPTSPAHRPKFLPSQKRASFTQYCPGGLIRYVENGFFTVKLIEDEKQEKPERYNKMVERKACRWGEGVAMYLAMDELAQYHRPSSSAL